MTASRPASSTPRAHLTGGWAPGADLSWSARRRLLTLLRTSALVMGCRRDGRSLGLLGYGGSVSVGAALALTLGLAATPALAGGPPPGGRKRKWLPDHNHGGQRTGPARLCRER
ncbi:MAG: hypothetical protein KGL69_04280, partial [Alphaproteobacteria bacterium]|nr:hypothetical protein [Alphaproteobacteria bacterium]